MVDYLDKVSHPMDFSSMQEKIDRHSYATFESFASDFELMISNCFTYNESDSYLYHYAIKMHKKVRTYWTSVLQSVIPVHHPGLIETV